MGDERDRMTWNEVVQATWDKRVEFWDELSQRNALAPDRPADLERVMAALQLHPGSRLLDAGCGSGQFAIAFARAGCRVTAIDIAPAMIDRARQHGSEAGVTIDWQVGDAGAVTAPMAIYDAIHARVVLQFVSDVPAALSAFRRVLRPGGRLLVSVPGALSPIYNRMWQRFLDPGSVYGTNFITPWEIEELLHALGWRVLDGWGEFGESLTGEDNPLSAEEVARLPRRLQQAAATTWTTIAG